MKKITIISFKKDVTKEVAEEVKQSILKNEDGIVACGDVISSVNTIEFGEDEDIRLKVNKMSNKLKYLED